MTMTMTMTRARFPAIVFVLLAVFTSSVLAGDEEQSEGAKALAALEALREQVLNEQAESLERALADMGRESIHGQGDGAASEILETYNEKLRELEREFSEKRREIFGWPGGDDGDGDRGDEGRGKGNGKGREGKDKGENKRDEVRRELAKLEAERDRELRTIDEELDRELRLAREEARREDKPEKYQEKARRLRAKHYEKVSRIEDKFAEKRRHILSKVE